MGIPLLNYDYAWQIWGGTKKTSSMHPIPRGRSAVHGDGKLKKGGVELPVYRFGLVKND
jgi:hypothetical protein